MAAGADKTQKPALMTYIVCGVVIEQNGRYLLVQESLPKAYGKWNLPAGKVDEGETLEQAAIREAKEESGFDVELTGHLLTLQIDATRPVLHAYSARIIGGELRFPKEELLDAQWFTFIEIKAMHNQLRSPDYIVGAIERVQLT